MELNHLKLIIVENSAHKKVKKKHKEDQIKKDKSRQNQKDEREKKIDEQVEESFPASDTPSHVNPEAIQKKSRFSCRTGYFFYIKGSLLIILN